MSPTELFEEARLTEAVAAQEKLVRARPDDVGERLIFCDLLAFAGDRDAVRRHLDEVSIKAPDLADYIAEWRRLVAADDRRHAGAAPDFIIDPPPHVRPRLDAADRLRLDPVAGIADLIDVAEEMTPWVEGHLDGRPFDGWRDADDLLGPVVELFHADRYVWVPTEQVRKLRLEPVDGLRDRLYRPATVWLTDGRDWEVFVPALYTGSAQHPEDGIRTGAGVDWIETAGLMRGVGSRTFLFGDEELSLDEFRQVEVRQAYTG
jgi:type VI secretion system protein ImpE